MPPYSFTRRSDGPGNVIYAAHVNELQEAIEEIGSGVYNVMHYGAVGDGVTDDTAAIQAAIDAAAVVDGMVYLPTGIYAISAEVSIPAYVSFLGAGRGNAQGNTGTTILATAAGAFLDFDEPSYAAIGAFTFDGDSTATKGIRAIASHKSVWRDIAVINVAGDSFRLHNVQNAQFDSIETMYSTRGLWVDDGCGSCVFNALASHDNVEWQVKIGSSGTVASSYTEPTALVFIAPMLEWIAADPTASAVATLLVEGCSRALFINGNFTTAASAGNARPTVKVSVENSSTTSRLEFIDCSFIGGTENTTAFQVTDVSAIRFLGANIIVGADVGISVESNLSFINGTLPEFNNVDTELAVSGSASIVSNIINYVSGIHEFVVATEAFQVLKTYQAVGEAGFRFRTDIWGSLFWNDGSDFSADTNLYRGGAGIVKSDHKIVAVGGLGVGNSAAATTPGNVIKKIEIFDSGGNSLGYLAVYDGIT